MGLPARYVSGYLHPGSGQPNTTVEGESHSWVEWWCAAGWRSTHVVPAAHRRIRPRRPRPRLWRRRPVTRHILRWPFGDVRHCGDDRARLGRPRDWAADVLGRYLGGMSNYGQQPPYGQNPANPYGQAQPGSTASRSSRTGSRPQDASLSRRIRANRGRTRATGSVSPAAAAIRSARPGPYGQQPTQWTPNHPPRGSPLSSSARCQS